MFIKLYKVLARPHLEYGNIIWNPYLKRQPVAVEQVQRRATRLVEECTEMTYTERLKCLKLHSLKGRRLRGEFIETCRIFNNLEGIEFQNLFSLVKSDKTRNAEGKIYVEHCNTHR